MKQEEFIDFVHGLKSEEQRLKEAICSDTSVLVPQVAKWLADVHDMVEGTETEQLINQVQVSFRETQNFPTLRFWAWRGSRKVGVEFVVDSAFKRAVARLQGLHEPNVMIFFVRTGIMEWRITGDPNLSAAKLAEQPILTQEGFYDCCRELLSV